MNTSRVFKLIGALVAEAPQCGERYTSITFDFCEQYDQSLESTQHVSGTNATPYDLDLGGVAQVYLVALRILSGGPLTLLIDSAAGTGQVLPVSQEIFLDNKGGVPITRIQIVGTADIEFMIAGT